MTSKLCNVNNLRKLFAVMPQDPRLMGVTKDVAATEYLQKAALKLALFVAEKNFGW